MSNRSYLFSLRVGHALRESFRRGYTPKSLAKDVMAGLTVGVVAIPMAMALAIASGVAPQYGLYTAIIAGFLIALTGGSRFSVSGPTAAFVVILFPVAQKYGLAGLLMATVMAGFILITMAFLRLGRLIEYIPEAVTLGFTAGIAVVIVILQIQDILGLQLPSVSEHNLHRLSTLVKAAPGAQWPTFIIALVTFLIMLYWPRLNTPVPPHLPAVILGALAVLLLNQTDLQVETIGSRFQYQAADGSIGHGIPPVLPSFAWPWQQPGADGTPLQFNWQLLRDLLPAAFGIAMLAAIESLLCAWVLDDMSRTRHSANSELLGQGIGNVITPFFGGITATAAISRSVTNFRSGAQSPIAAIVHSLVVLLGLIALAPLLAHVPMAAMAGLLVVTAWNMSDAPRAIHLVKTAPRNDVMVFMTCFLLTVVFDMVLAITTGVILAAMLFIKDMADLTRIRDITQNKRWVSEAERPPAGWHVYKIDGPLFFAAADKIFAELSQISSADQGIILYMDSVPVLDSGGLAALTRLIEHCRDSNKQLLLADLNFQPLRALVRAGIKPIEGVFRLHSTLQDALASLQSTSLSSPSNH